MVPKIAAGDQEIGRGKSRHTFLDVFRGIGILATVEIHVCGSVLPSLIRGSVQQTLLYSLTRCLLFAVPAFLMLTTLLQVRKVDRKVDWREILQKAAQNIAYPYFLWSLFYILLAYKNHQIHVTLLQLLWNLCFGKAYGSLYFLRVLFQLLILLPLISPLLRRRPSDRLILVSTLVLTLAFYCLNRFVLRIPAIGSVIFWYLPGVGAGVWLGSHFDEIAAKLKSALWWTIPVSLISIFFYLPLALQEFSHQNVNTFHYQVAEWCYTSCASLVLLFVAWKLSQTARISRLFEKLGANSMQIYLIHPFLLNFAARLLPVEKLIPFWATLVIYPVLIVPICLGCAILCRRLKLSALLFGRT